MSSQYGTMPGGGPFGGTLNEPDTTNTLEIGTGRSRTERLEDKAESLEEKGKKYKAELARLKAEYGTTDRNKIYGAMSAEALRDYQDNPFRASGVGARQQDAMLRSAQAVREATSDQLRRQLGLATMRGQAPDASAAMVEAQKTADLAGAVERGEVAQMVRDKVREQGKEKMAAFMGYPILPQQNFGQRFSQEVLPALLADVADEEAEIDD